MKKNDHLAGPDPHAQREAEKYQRPIASREYILELLGRATEPLKEKQLALLLEIEEEEDRIALQRRLRAMERDGQLIRNRRNGYGLAQKMDLVTGRVSAHPDGFGFLIPDDGGDDLFLSARQMRSLFNRDRIITSVTGIDRRGRREGSVVEILQRNTHKVVGRYVLQAGIGFIQAEDKRITHDVIIPPDAADAAHSGQIVVAEIVEQPELHRKPIGKIVEVLGEHMAPGMEIDVAIRTHALPFAWPAAVTQEMKRIPREVTEPDKQHRRDLRHLPFVTIDGADARDFDDAVYCEKLGRNWRLLVAIADVASYVIPGTALDDEAKARGTSVYFPERVIPMLPEELSNGLCSLNPNTDRLSLVCDMTISQSGSVTGYEFYNAVFQSQARLIYDDVAVLLSGQKVTREDAKTEQRDRDLLPHLQDLEKVYHCLSVNRKKRGAIEFETTETVIRFDAQRKIASIEPLFRNDAHRLIEECMIAANICAALFLDAAEIPSLYRIHEPPKTEKMQDLRAFLSELGLDLGGGPKPKPKHYAELLTSIRQRQDWKLIQTVMLRSLNQAVYHPENHGHFGLALTHYAHFTSPIRRYPDLLVHRAIKHVLAQRTVPEFGYSAAEMVTLGEHCSTTERRADDATRDVVDWLKCEFMMDKVGQTFPGIITGVTSFGIFVELLDIYVEGLVHVTSLSNDYYHFDPVKHSLIGERTRTRYRLGDPIAIQVMRVDLDEKQIDFALVGGVTAEKPTAKGSKNDSPPSKRDAKGKGKGKAKPGEPAEAVVAVKTKSAKRRKRSGKPRR